MHSATFTWSSREPMTAGDIPESRGDDVSHPAWEYTPVGTVRAFFSGLLPKCAKSIYHGPLYLQSALEEGSTVVVVKLDIVDFSYSCPKWSFIGSCFSVDIVHVQVVHEFFSRNPSLPLKRETFIHQSWLKLTFWRHHLRHQSTLFEFFFFPKLGLKYAISISRKSSDVVSNML